jgi:hypothetical protein
MTHPLAIRRVLLLGLGLILSCLLAMAAFTQTNAGDVTKRGDQRVAQAETSLWSLTVKVLAVQTSGQRPDPVARAIVRVEGSDDSLETNDKGVAKLSGLLTEKVKLRVMVPGADICRLSDLAVASQNKMVEVQVERWAGGQCKSKILD